MLLPPPPTAICLPFVYCSARWICTPLLLLLSQLRAPFRRDGVLAEWSIAQCPSPDLTFGEGARYFNASRHLGALHGRTAELVSRPSPASSILQRTGDFSSCCNRCGSLSHRGPPHTVERLMVRGALPSIGWFISQTQPTSWPEIAHCDPYGFSGRICSVDLSFYRKRSTTTLQRSEEIQHRANRQYLKGAHKPLCNISQPICITQIHRMAPPEQHPALIVPMLREMKHRHVCILVANSHFTGNNKRICNNAATVSSSFYFRTMHLSSLSSFKQPPWSISPPEFLAAGETLFAHVNVRCARTKSPIVSNPATLVVHGQIWASTAEREKTRIARRVDHIQHNHIRNACSRPSDLAGRPPGNAAGVAFHQGHFTVSICVFRQPSECAISTCSSSNIGR